MALKTNVLCGLRINVLSYECMPQGAVQREISRTLYTNYLTTSMQLLDNVSERQATCLSKASMW